MVVHLLQGMNLHEHFIIIQSPWFALQLILAAGHFMGVDPLNRVDTQETMARAMNDALNESVAGIVKEQVRKDNKV